MWIVILFFKDSNNSRWELSEEVKRSASKGLIAKVFNVQINVKAVDHNDEFDLYIEDFSDETFAGTPFYFFTQFPPAVVAAFEKQLLGRHLSLFKAWIFLKIEEIKHFVICFFPTAVNDKKLTKELKQAK
ncbi:hypothetical protein RFI_01963 [Reticulomyxa filosa]|uniref:Uncharacterized protein n=1 Tax=Reticulomyxa filosa TaxID=46433 RepID=X6PAB5_RETFI|nr:hypothetical protein RFI_01963 [Reticulomyxa filosa]|eukprot:ETO35111.1 hypothetical protein RFI_01963 [Reticulomyxa filosa]